jgi:AcrR family transcriptional regulator
MALDEDSRQLDRVAQRRKQILDAAYQVFAGKGYAAATIADVAQALRLGHGTIYRYFDNKLDLFMAVVGGILSRLSAAIASEDPQRASTLEEYRAQVERIGRTMLSLLDSDPAVTKILFYEAMGISAELDERIHQAWEMAGRVTELYLQNGKQRGFLRASLDSEVTALAINALTFEAGRRIVRSADPTAARERWLKAVTALIFEGVAAAPVCAVQKPE